jgi:hypothetical protein
MLRSMSRSSRMSESTVAETKLNMRRAEESNARVHVCYKYGNGCLLVHQIIYCLVQQIFPLQVLRMQLR